MRTIIIAALAALAACATANASDEILTAEEASWIAAAYNTCPDGTLSEEIAAGAIVVYARQNGMTHQKAANELDMLAELRLAGMTRETRAMLCVVAGRLDTKYSGQ